MSTTFADGSIICDMCGVIGQPRWRYCEKCDQFFCESHHHSCAECGAECYLYCRCEEP